MTAVTVFTTDQCPFIVSDSLVSGFRERLLSSIPTVPTLGELYVATSQLVPVDLRQKVCILNDRLVMGWAGPVISAMGLFSELANFVDTSSFSFEELQAYLDNQVNLWEELSIVGLQSDVNGGYRTFGRGRVFHDPRLTNMSSALAIGSGDQHLLNALHEVLRDPPPITFTRHTDPHSMQAARALGNTLFAVSVIASRDQVSSETLADDLRYGGAYEIAGFNGLRYVKLGDRSHVVWAATKRDGKTLVSLVRVYKYDYQNDLLVVRAIHFEGSKVTSDRTYPIAPITRYLSEEEQRNTYKPSLDSAWQCHSFLFRPNEAGNMDVRIVFSSPQDGASKVRFEEREEGISIIKANDFFEAAFGDDSEVVWTA